MIFVREGGPESDGSSIVWKTRRGVGTCRWARGWMGSPFRRRVRLLGVRVKLKMKALWK